MPRSIANTLIEQTLAEVRAIHEQAYYQGFDGPVENIVPLQAAITRYEFVAPVVVSNSLLTAHALNWRTFPNDLFADMFTIKETKKHIHKAVITPCNLPD